MGARGAVLARCAQPLDEQPDPAQASFGELVNNANTDRPALSDPTGTPLAQLTANGRRSLARS